MPQMVLNCAFLLPFSVYPYLPKSVQFYLPITRTCYFIKFVVKFFQLILFGIS